MNSSLGEALGLPAFVTKAAAREYGFSLLCSRLQGSVSVGCNAA